MSRSAKWALRFLGAAAGLLLLVGLLALLILPSTWFRDKVRDRMITEIERATGGQSEIGSFLFDWKTLTAEVAPFVLRGTEPTSEPPLFRAESIKVGLKIISIVKRDIDIASAVVERPQVNILVDAEGRTNLPQPQVRRTSGTDPVDMLIRLAIDRIDLRDGWVRYADRKFPLELQGEDLQARLDYDRIYHPSGPSYRGAVSIRQLTLDTRITEPAAFDFETNLVLLPNRILLESARVARNSTEVLASGSIVNFKSPRIEFDVKANATLVDLGHMFHLPRPHTGTVNFAGKLTYGGGERLLVAGRVQGSGLAVRQSFIQVDDIGVQSNVRLTPDLLELRGTRVQALGGTFSGATDLYDWKRYKVNGRVDGLSVETLSRMGEVRRTPYSGGVTGPVEVTGTVNGRDLKAAGRFDLTPGGDGIPVSGFVEAAYDQRRNTVQLGESHVVLPASRLNVSGTLGDSLRVRLESRDLKDVLPAISMFAEAPEALPVSLRQGGSAVFEGAVNGPLRTAQVKGALTMTAFEAQQQPLDRLVANIEATPSHIHASTFALGQETARLEGSANLALDDWRLRDNSPVEANVKLQGASLQKLLKAAGQELPISGQLSATAAVDGVASDPRAMIRATVEQPVLYGEKFDRVRAEVRYAGAGVEVITGVAELGSARVLLTGAYEHPVNDYKNGRLRFNASTQGFSLQRVANIQKLRPGVRGGFELKATGTANVRDGDLRPDDLSGLFAVRNLIVDSRPVGDFTVDAATSDSFLTLGVAGNLRGSRVTGGGSFKLAGDYPGDGKIEFSPIRISTLQDFLKAARGSDSLPVEGTLQGVLTFSGPAANPAMMQAKLNLPSLEVVPDRQALTQKQVAELTLRNEGPVVVEYDGKAVNVREAHLVGTETDLRASGSINLNEKSPWDLRVDGQMNLGVLQSFDEDVISSGVAVVKASVRGSMQDPEVTGRMELKNASFYVTDFPNGLDNAAGTILFDRQRATIEKLTAETGGGSIAIDGFVGFGTPEPAYRLQARADNVRVRYPEGVSTTVSSTLSLSGSSSRSILSGVVTVRRVGFNPRTDIGGILASSGRPVATPVSPNPYLRGMQLDVQIESAPNLQFQTTLTDDLQAEADLRVRGTLAKPTLLGRVVVNHGEVQFFGNKYTINRGEIGFFNPVNIEPVLDMDLETRVRGVLVTINFNGPISKLNVSYRSDPPLQSTEIVALLAVGRAPGTNSALAAGQTVASQGFLSTPTNSLLGQAIAAPISGRLQRFFGVSRLKIDPQLTGINAVPQARLTVEQQISRDVTLTYITNLSQANQQIIRLEWDLDRSWSVVALREENGAFGVDFFFKKRFR